MAKDKVTKKESVETSTKVKRVYGKRKNVGNILENTETGELFCRIQAGFFGFHTLRMIKQEDGTFSLEKQYFVENEMKTVKIGKTFPARDKESNPIEGITQAVIGLNTVYDKELKKNITGSNDALFITTQLLKVPEKVSDTIKKIGWIVGEFGIEID